MKFIKFISVIFTYLGLRLLMLFRGEKLGELIEIPGERRLTRNMKPKEGFAYNPLLKFPRNTNCYCDSGVKFKECCLPKLKRAIPEKDAEQMQAYIDYRLRSES